jgi:hypothetical protein
MKMVLKETPNKHAPYFLKITTALGKRKEILAASFVEGRNLKEHLVSCCMV